MSFFFKAIQVKQKQREKPFLYRYVKKIRAAARFEWKNTEVRKSFVLTCFVGCCNPMFSN
jgi:hypothetical protein